MYMLQLEIKIIRDYIAANDPSDPGGIQTHDLQNRNLTLYSAKLRNQSTAKLANNYQFAIEY